MEEAENALECIVVMTNATGEIVWLCSSDAMSTKLGLLETAKQCIVAGIDRSA